MFSFLFTLLSLNVGLHNTTVDPDQSKYILDIVSDKGFSSQVHYTTTADGYILELHRILPQWNRTEPSPVILMPGMGCTSGAFIVGSPHSPPLDREVGNNLAFVLSQAGYDVWLPNVRGNKYSINHVTTSAKDELFWDYSLDEMVRYDLPSIINYVKNHSKADAIGYVGHSQGTTLMFALLASQPETYSTLIRPFVALAPAVAMSTGTFGLLDHFFHLSMFPLSSTSKPVWSNYSLLFKPVPPSTCQRYLPVCENFIDLIFGPDYAQLNTTRLAVYLTHIVSSFSLKTVQHYSQMYNADRFQKFDYGPLGNLRVYGQEQPPEYRLDKITSRHIALIYSANDHLISLEDIHTVRNSLKVPLLDDYLVPDPQWNHIDFILAKETGRYINSRVLEILDKSYQLERNLTSKENNIVNEITNNAIY